MQPPTPPRLVIEPEAINRVEARLAQMTQDGAFTGSVLIAQDGKILLSNGYGLADRARGIPNTPQTRFHLGSISKVFTGMGILILKSQGKLSKFYTVSLNCLRKLHCDLRTRLIMVLFEQLPLAVWCPV